LLVRGTSLYDPGCCGRPAFRLQRQDSITNPSIAFNRSSRGYRPPGVTPVVANSQKHEKELIMADADVTPSPEPPSKEELRLAMKAFRKRLKLTRLDEESRLGHGPMSSGQQSAIMAITPPDQFPKAVWRELANQGKLRREQGGLYSLIES
jgi:hypothetical protein